MPLGVVARGEAGRALRRDRKSTRLNSSHVEISYAVFCLKKKKKIVRKSYTSGAATCLPALISVSVLSKSNCSRRTSKTRPFGIVTYKYRVVYATVIAESI